MDNIDSLSLKVMTERQRKCTYGQKKYNQKINPDFSRIMKF